MKLECLKEKLAGVIYKAEKITGKTLTLPVLKCVLLEAQNNNLKIKATNLDLGIEIDLPVKVQEGGIMAVSGQVLNSFIQNLYNGKNISLKGSEGNLIVSSQGNSSTIKSLPHEDFPTIPHVSIERSFKINAKDFVRGLKAVWYSSSTSTMKPELSSVFIYPDEEILVFAATDSFRLAEKRVKLKRPKDFNQILLPFKNVPEIIRILDEIDDEIEISLDKNQIAFSYQGLYLTSRIIDGVFPDYKQIIPKEFKTEVIVLKQDFINSLKLANIFSDSFNQVSMTIHPSEKIFGLKTKNSDIGENNNKVDATFSGEDVDINFNYKYIVDCFQSIDSDSVSLQFNSLNRPMVIRGIGDKSFMYLVMPMNR
jgi:DNA polymerase-3 subunit beta